MKRIHQNFSCNSRASHGLMTTGIGAMPAPDRDRTGVEFQRRNKYATTPAGSMTIWKVPTVLPDRVLENFLKLQENVAARLFEALPRLAERVYSRTVASTS